MMDIICVLDAKASLGEGPCWDTEAKCLWWLDIYAREIHCYDPRAGIDEVYPTPQVPGSLALRAAGGLVLAMGDGFHFFDTDHLAFTPIVMPEADLPATRFNDGRTDRQGRFWAGSVFEVEGQSPQSIGGLYRLDPDLSCHRMAGEIGCSNGLAWSPDGRSMYHTDSHKPFIWVWDYDPITGAIENRRVFVDLSAIEAVADGATVDAEGCYWVALPFKGQVHRYDPAGRLIQSITMPVDAPTCCEFGGEALDILYVTSGTLSRPANALVNQPHAGGLFAIDVGVRGLAAAPFAG